MVHTIEKKFFLLWHGSYCRHIPVYFMPADEGGNDVGIKILLQKRLQNRTI